MQSRARGNGTLRVACSSSGAIASSHSGASSDLLARACRDGALYLAVAVAVACARRDTGACADLLA